MPSHDPSQLIKIYQEKIKNVKIEKKEQKEKEVKTLPSLDQLNAKDLEFSLNNKENIEWFKSKFGD